MSAEKKNIVPEIFAGAGILLLLIDAMGYAAACFFASGIAYGIIRLPEMLSNIGKAKHE